MFHDLLADLGKHVSGFIGASVAVFLLKDTWPRRVLLFVSGSAAAYYGAPYVTMRSGADHELAGFLTGMFSMAVVSKIFEMVDALKPKELWDRVLKRWGL